MWIRTREKIRLNRRQPAHRGCYLRVLDQLLHVEDKEPELKEPFSELRNIFLVQVRRAHLIAGVRIVRIDCNRILVVIEKQMQVVKLFTLLHHLAIHPLHLEKVTLDVEHVATRDLCRKLSEDIHSFGKLIRAKPDGFRLLNVVYLSWTGHYVEVSGVRLRGKTV